MPIKNKKNRIAGDNTTTQCQSITLVNFNMMNTKVKKNGVNVGKIFFMFIDFRKVLCSCEIQQKLLI